MAAPTPARAELRFSANIALLAGTMALFGCSSSDERPGSAGPDASLLDGALADVPSASPSPDATPRDRDAARRDASAGGSDGFDGAVTRYPPLLSQTGLFADVATEALGEGVRPFQPAHVLWTDGATKRRWVRLPDAPIDSSDMSFWRYPEGTRLWKEFSVDGQRIETRLLHKHGPRPSDWVMIAYLWLDDGSDAVAVPDGVENATGTDHDVPSQEDCQFCHGNMADRVLGFTALQLSHAAGGVTLDGLRADGHLSEAPTGPIVLPGDAASRAAVGHLHANCGLCHNPTSEVFTSVDMNLWQSATALDAVEDTNVYRTAVGLPDPGARVNRIVPGDPSRSMIYVRMSVRGNGQMPPIGTEVPDLEGLAQIAAFIRSLGARDRGDGGDGGTDARGVEAGAAEAGIADAAAGD